jgi:hypothetical protein
LDIFVVKISCSRISRQSGTKRRGGKTTQQTNQQCLFKNGVHKWGGSKNSLMGDNAHQSNGSGRTPKKSKFRSRDPKNRYFGGFIDKMGGTPPYWGPPPGGDPPPRSIPGPLFGGTPPKRGGSGPPPINRVGGAKNPPFLAFLGGSPWDPSLLTGFWTPFLGQKSSIYKYGGDPPF